MVPTFRRHFCPLLHNHTWDVALNVGVRRYFNVFVHFKCNSNKEYFKEYFSNRIGETYDNIEKIIEVCPVGIEGNGEWYHTSSANNPADLPSRIGAKIEDLGEDSNWQKGPETFA